MPLYQRKGSPFWQYSFSVNGVRFRGSTERTGKREAAAVEAEKRHEAERNQLPRDNWTLHQCLGAYWSDRGKHRASEDTILAKLAALRKHLGKETAIMALTNAKLMDYRARRRGEGLQPHSVNRDFAILKAALNNANQMHGQQIPALAWSRIKVEEPPHRIRFLSREEYHRLLEACDPALAKLVRVAVGTGLRRGNLLRLDWKQVDLSSGIITVRVKGNKNHTVRITAATRAALSTDTERKGALFDTTNFRRRWQGAVDRAELEDLRFHDLRHTFASWARMAGADLADICEALGHSSVAVTMRYAHIQPATHTTAFDRVSADVWSQSPSQSTVEEAK